MNRRPLPPTLRKRIPPPRRGGHAVTLGAVPRGGAAAVMAIVALTAGLAIAPTAQAVPSTVEKTVEQINTEALRSNQSDQGRPLPLVSHWHRRDMTPAYEVRMIREGHHIIPWLDFWNSGGKYVDHHADALKQIARWHLPMQLITQQWESHLYNNDATGAMDLDGKKTKRLDPLGAAEPWEAMGRKLAQSDYIKKLEALYPDPPLIFIASNNEARHALWRHAEKSKRYMDKYGPGRSDAFKRKVYGDGWIRLYGALFKGMRENLDKPAWRKNIRFVGYKAFGPGFMGRWDDWLKHSEAIKGRIAWEPQVWDGGVIDSYDNDWQPGKTAYHVWSMQIEAMNTVFMKREALKVNPDFWTEVIFWDGHPGKYYKPDNEEAHNKSNNKHKQYAANGIDYTPALYGGWTRYVIWTITPRVVWEFRLHHRVTEIFKKGFAQVLDAVDHIHTNPVLKRFWRKGELVVNPEGKNPYDAAIPAWLQDKPRWFGLSTSADPPRPWKRSTKLPVYALARVLGEKGSRQWLLYAHAPLGDREQVTITLPGYGEVTVDVKVGGSFYLVDEAKHKVSEVTP